MARKPQQPSEALAKRPVEAIEGEVLPPLQPMHTAGYDPMVLDPVLGGLIGSAKMAQAAFDGVLPLLGKATEQLGAALAKSETEGMPASMLADQAETTASVVEKAAKIVAQLAKALDSLSRLRSLLSGGPDRRIEEVHSMSNDELMALVLAAIGKCPKCGARLG